MEQVVDVRRICNCGLRYLGVPYVKRITDTGKGLSLSI